MQANTKVQLICFKLASQIFPSLTPCELNRPYVHYSQLFSNKSDCYSPNWTFMVFVLYLRSLSNYWREPCLIFQTIQVTVCRVQRCFSKYSSRSIEPGIFLKNAETSDWFDELWDTWCDCSSTVNGNNDRKVEPHVSFTWLESLLPVSGDVKPDPVQINLDLTRQNQTAPNTPSKHKDQVWTTLLIIVHS